MRSNTARKVEMKSGPLKTSTREAAQIFDFTELSKVQVAVQAEMACHMRANKTAPDFEEFMNHYGITESFA